MGQAKLKKANTVPTVFHHTSTLRTNMLWMSGKILPEGQMPPVLHPHLGPIGTDALLRRAMVDFPPLTWFTTRISVPNCLVLKELHFQNKDGSVFSVPIDRPVANGIALNRFAIGFRVADIPVVPWPEHRGYDTAEGRALNETAREAGDNPEDWYVSEQAIDLMLASEIWFSRDKYNPKLTREDWYLKDMKAMVERCRTTPGVYIPPSWLNEEQAVKLARSMGVPAMWGNAKPIQALR
jgi:hypothetical protein